MVSYSSFDPSAYLSPPADFALNQSSSSTANPAEPIALQARSNPGGGGEPQELNQYFNDHIGLAVVDLFQSATNQNPFPTQQQPPIPPEQQHPLLLSLQHNQPRSSPLTDQDQHSPPHPSGKQPLSIDTTTLRYETFQQTPTQHTHAQNQHPTHSAVGFSHLMPIDAQPPAQPPSSTSLGVAFHPSSETPPAPRPMPLSSSASASISPAASVANPIRSHEEQILSSAPGSSMSRSPQTDSSNASRLTDQSIRHQAGYPTPPNGEVAINASIPHSASAALLGPLDTFGTHAHDRPRRDPFETAFPPLNPLPSSTGSESHLSRPPAQPEHYNQVFHDFGLPQHLHGPLPLMPQVDPSANSCSAESGHLHASGGVRRRSGDPCSSPVLTGSGAPLPTSTLPAAWVQNPPLGYPASTDLYGQRQSAPLYYPSQGPLPAQRAMAPDEHGQGPKTQGSEENKQADRSPFAFNHSGVSPSTSWSPDELAEHQSSGALLPPGLQIGEPKTTFNYQPPQPGGQAFEPHTPVDDQFKLLERQSHPGANTTANAAHCNSLGLMSAYSQPRGPYLDKIPENLVVLGEAGSGHLSNHHGHGHEESGHNAVEKRYRNNINSHIASLADLVPALQHLRALPSAATSRRHSSQFIVSTSAIGKIPTGLVDGVKAATKLSKGNILSKSVDYVRHLIRARLELKEDIEDLKKIIKSRVDGGEILILQWEEMVNGKSAERERQRVLEQSQGDDDGDEEDEMNETGGRKGSGGVGASNGAGPAKKRKMTDQKGTEGGKLRNVRAGPKAFRKGQPLGEFVSQHISAGAEEMLIPPDLPSSRPNLCSIGHHVPGTRPEQAKGMAHELVDELDGLLQPPSSYHHQYLTGQGNHQDYSHLQPPGYSPDFMGHPFAPSQPAEQRAQPSTSIHPRPLLAAFMGISFAVGTGYNYQQSRRKKQEQDGKTSDFPGSCSTAESSTGSSLARSSCSIDTSLSRSQALGDSFSALSLAPPQVSVLQAGLNAMSIASVIWTLMLMFWPEFLLTLVGPRRLRRARKGAKSRHRVVIAQPADDTDESSDCGEGEAKGAPNRAQHVWMTIETETAGALSEEDEDIVCGRSRLPGDIQYERLSMLAKRPRGRTQIAWSLLSEAIRTVAVLVWGEVVQKMIELDRGGRQGRRERAGQIRQILIWTRLAEIESSWDRGRASVANRLHTVFRLYNLTHAVDWKDRATRVELDLGRISAVVALLLRTVLGDRNQLSALIWRRATDAHLKARLAAKEDAQQGAVLPVRGALRRPGRGQIVAEGWLAEAMGLDYDEVCTLLAEKRTTYILLSVRVGALGGRGGWSPLKQLVEARAELQLIEIWSRIFVSAIQKTCPVSAKSKTIRGAEFGLDGGLAELPTRLEEASEPYALQISQARRRVEESIERICRLNLGRGSAVGRMARVTRGMWAMAFGKREVAVTAAEELKEDGAPAEEEEVVGCVDGFVELVLGTRPFAVATAAVAARGNMGHATLDKLAKMTIDWLLVRREHVLLNVAEGPKQNFLGVGGRERLLKRCDELKAMLEMSSAESEKNRELNAKSTKQTDEAVKAGEAKEFDLKKAIEECMNSVKVIQDENLNKPMAPKVETPLA